MWPQWNWHEQEDASSRISIHRQTYADHIHMTSRTSSCNCSNPIDNNVRPQPFQSPAQWSRPRETDGTSGFVLPPSEGARHSDQEQVHRWPNTGWRTLQRRKQLAIARLELLVSKLYSAHLPKTLAKLQQFKIKENAVALDQRRPFRETGCGEVPLGPFEYFGVVCVGAWFYGASSGSWERQRPLRWRS